MQNFDTKEFIDLDECVINALNLFIKEKPPVLNLKYDRPLIVGSGNAAVTGKIIFRDSDVVVADEGTWERKLTAAPNIDGVLVISSSGEKHAPILAKKLKEKGLHITLLTNNPNASAKEFADTVFVSPKNSEPYTYNTSTYMGMMLGNSTDDPQTILDWINNTVRGAVPQDLKKYDAFYLIVPTDLDNVRELFATKFDELFGPKISGRVFTPEQTKHAKTVVPSDSELFISFGYHNEHFGKNKLHIPIPNDTGPATLMAIGYWVIGQIQKQNEPYFKNNIVQYVEEASKIFGSTLEPIVE